MRKQAESEGRTFQYDRSVRDKMRNSLSPDATESEARIDKGIEALKSIKV